MGIRGERVRRGEEHRKAQIEKRDSIREAITSGKAFTDISKEFGVPESSVRYIAANME